VREVPVVRVLPVLAAQVGPDAASPEQLREVHVVLVFLDRRDGAVALRLVADRTDVLCVTVPAVVGDVGVAPREEGFLYSAGVL